MTPDSGASLTQRLKSIALAVGFDRVGISRPNPSRETEFFRDWIARGYAGSMDYLGARVEERVDPRLVLPTVRSVVSVGLFYNLATSLDEFDDPGPGVPKIARYAAGEDYHELMLDRLKALARAVEAASAEPVETRAYVDTGPVLERVFAARSGVGWIGKNTCVIDPERGSYLFLGALLTSLDLEPDAPEPDHCGSCRACLDACPTDAFAAPYELDATRCIAYTTIEDPGPIPDDLRADHGDRLFGCDICQEVCPWNRPKGRPALPDPLGLRERLSPDGRGVRQSLAWILGLDEEAWRSATRRSAIRRTKYRGLIRNALVVAGNLGEEDLIPRIEPFVRGSDPLLAEHASWALEQIRTRQARA